MSMSQNTAFILGMLYLSYKHNDNFIKFRQYFIMEYTDNMSVVLPRTLFEHLFDLDKKDTDVDLNTRNFGLQKTGLGMTAKELDEQFDEEIDEKIFEEIMNKAGFKKPTVDEILDKINEFGIESLTPLEQSVLKSQE